MSSRAQDSRKAEMSLRKYTVINNSIRIYNIKEIYQFIENKEYPEEFQRYLRAAPDNIKNLLNKMGMEQSYLSVEEDKTENALYAEAIAINEEPAKEIIQPDRKTENVLPTVDEARKEDHIPKELPKTDSSGAINKQKDENLYENLRFGDSITVKRLVLHEMTHSSCIIHGSEYQNIRVVISLPKGEFAIRTRCCPQCKKLYVKKENFQGVKKLLDRKNVNYTWIPEDK